jgi:hypothetical protein
MTAIAGMVTSAAGTVGAASAQQTQGAASNRAAGLQAAGVTYRAETNAAIGEYRAGLTEWAAATNEGFAMARANRVEAEAAAQAEIITRSTSRVMGRATAAYGASGVTGGSSLWVLNDIATEGQLQANLTIYGAKVQAGDIRQQAKFDTQAAQSQAVIYRALATAERTAGQIGAAALYAGGQVAADAANTAAGTTLLTGLGKVGDMAGKAFGTGSPTTTTTPEPKPGGTVLDPAVMPSVSSIDKKIGF